jgi:hypothetical protein
MIVTGLTQAEVNEREAAEAAAKKEADARAALLSIDSAAIRPLLSIVAGIDTKEDREKIKELADQAKALRTEARKA